jgi:Tfp pilus assembly protein PilX
MKREQNLTSHNERGIALVTTLLLTLLLSLLVGAMLMSSSADTLISGNDVRSNKAFYIAEAGIRRGAGWFSARFGADPNTGLYILPRQFPSNTTGAAGQLSYTDAPFYQKGALTTSPEQAMPTSVKVLSGGVLQNVVLTGDSTNTYPTSYSVPANNQAGTPVTFSYSNVVSDFTNNLVNQTADQGKFTVRATLVSIVPPTSTQQGNVTWLLQSTGRITRSGDKTIASATLSAYISARVTPITATEVTSVAGQQINAGPGVISRMGIKWNDNPIRLDSYKSSKGLYGANLAANSFIGQIGLKNIGSRGDARTNNDDGGYINVGNGVITGKTYSTLPKPTDLTAIDPITIDTTKVQDGQGNSFSLSNKFYGQPPLIFPEPPDPTPPAPGAPNYNYNTNSTNTLPAGNWNNISITKGKLFIPPGNYGAVDLSSQGVIVLGMPNQSTTYNLQDFSSAASSTIVFRGQVTINVKNSLDVHSNNSIEDLGIRASDIRWNFKGGAGQTISVGGSGDTLGVFYAPNNDLQVTGNGEFYGAITARNVIMKGNADIHIDEDSVPGVLTTSTITTTTSTVVGYTATNYSLWRITQQIN